MLQSYAINNYSEKPSLATGIVGSPNVLNLFSAFLSTHRPVRLLLHVLPSFPYPV